MVTDGDRNLLPLPEAEQTLNKALAIQRELAADFPRVMYYRYDLVRSLRALGRLLGEREERAVGAHIAKLRGTRFADRGV